MNRAVRILLIILGVLLALILVLAMAGASVARSPLPDVDGERSVALPDDCAAADAGDSAALCVALTGHGLTAPVHVYRDDYGIAHIYAENSDDLFFAQGYVHAQDRM